MRKASFSRIFIVFVALTVSSFMIFGNMAQSQEYDPGILTWYYLWPNSIWSIPESIWLVFLDSLNPRFDPYFNSINNPLLGYMSFTPFLSPQTSMVYGLARIPTYQFFGSPYRNTFPYITPGRTGLPYARFDYPTYVYGSTDFYVDWISLQ